MPIFGINADSHPVVYGPTRIGDSVFGCIRREMAITVDAPKNFNRQGLHPALVVVGEKNGK